jgi:hypothetical protein
VSTDRLKDDLEEQITRLEELVSKLADEIRRLRVIRDAIGDRSASAYAAVPDEPKSQFQRIAEVLMFKGNRPRTTRAIMRETGISRSALSQILHRTHKDSFVSTPIPGYSRKKLWSLTEEAARMAAAQLGTRLGSPTLFGTEGEFWQMAGVDCCARILREHGNEPMTALTLAREAMQRGYRGRVKASEDEMLLTTAKSFWAALGRDERFEQVRPLVFKLKDGGGK